MDDGRDKSDDGAANTPPAPPRRPYSAPQIVWREPYEPVSFGLSCAKQPGNPGCNPGPTTA
jgi:hypothetical protein